jgi:hypothetical protein
MHQFSKYSNQKIQNLANFDLDIQDSIKSIQNNLEIIFDDISLKTSND